MNCLFAQSLSRKDRPEGDPLRVDPAHYSIESETDGMFALRLKLGPGEASPMAYFQDSLIVCTSECHIRLVAMAQAPGSVVLKSGKARNALLTDTSISGRQPTSQIIDIHMQAGATRLMGAGMRSIANLSTQPVEMLFIERKELASDLK